MSSTEAPRGPDQGAGLSRRNLLGRAASMLAAPAAAALAPVIGRRGVDIASADGGGPSFIQLESGIFYAGQEDGAGFLIKKPMAAAFQDRGGDADWGKPVSSEFVDDQGMTTQAFERATFQLSANGRECVVTEYDAATQPERPIPIQNQTMYKVADDGKAEPLAPTIIISPDGIKEDILISGVSLEIGESVPGPAQVDIRTGVSRFVRAARQLAGYEPVGLAVLAYHTPEEIALAEGNRLKRPTSTLESNVKFWTTGEARASSRSVYLYTGGDLWQRHNSIRHISTVAHEAYHTIQFELGKKSPVSPADGVGPLGTMWLTEGSAECFSWIAAAIDDPNEYTKKRNETIAYAKRYPVSLKSMETTNGLTYATPDIGGGYGLAMLGIEFLVNTTPGGFRALTHYWDLIRNGKEWNQAFIIAFGRNTETFYQQHDNYVTSGYKLPTT